MKTTKPMTDSYANTAKKVEGCQWKPEKANVLWSDQMGANRWITTFLTAGRELQCVTLTEWRKRDTILCVWYTGDFAEQGTAFWPVRPWLPHITGVSWCQLHLQTTHTLPNIIFTLVTNDVVMWNWIVRIRWWEWINVERNGSWTDLGKDLKMDRK